MQISTGNLVSTQSQPAARPAGAATFEPMAFKTVVPGAAEQNPAVPGQTGTKPVPKSANATSAAAQTNGYTGYVKPGTHLDITV